jgi:MSHA biogenesis protein MshP
MFHKRTVVALVLKKQHGSALILALFIIVIMSLLGSVIIRILSSSAENIVYEVVGTRAYFAAQAGIQEGLHFIYPSPEPSGIECISIPYLSLPAPQDTILIRNYSNDGLFNCTATVKVSECESVETAVGFFEYYYFIESEGQCTVGEITTTRTIEVQSRSLGL